MWPDSIAVVGLGALGGAVAARARAGGVSRVQGYSASPATAVRALRDGVISERADSPAQAVRGAQLVVLSGAPDEVIRLIPLVSPHLASGAFLTDLAGTKVAVLRAIRSASLAARYAGLHPLVYLDGPGAPLTSENVFRGAITYVIADPEGEAARQAMRAFVSEVLEGEPVVIDAELHDRQVAWTLDLPRAAARALALALSTAGLRGAAYDRVARDATAPAGKEGGDWEARALSNPAAAVAALEGLEQELARLRDAIQRGDAAALRDLGMAAQSLSRALAR